MLTFSIIKLVRFLFDASAKIIGPKVFSSLEKEDIVLANEVKLRIYKPKIHTPPTHLPLIIYYPGGGWVIGSIKAYDRIIQYLCFKSNCILIVVEYRKAPEHKFPTALKDAIMAYNWILSNEKHIGFDQEHIALMGDSAGGNIAAHIQININKIKSPPKIMVLIYPVIDAIYKPFYAFKKERNWFIKKCGFTLLRFCLKCYLDSFKSHDLKKISLMATIKKLQTYPKILIITSQWDPLNKSIMKYMRKLKQCNADVTHKHYLHTLHGFINFAGISKNAKKALDDIIDFLTANYF